MNPNPVVIVTGASRGLGEAISGWLAKAGATVALLARSEKDLQRVSVQITQTGGRAIVGVTDVSDPEQCREAVDRIVQRTGRLDALVNNAGDLAPVATISTADPLLWQRNLTINLIGPFNMVQPAIVRLRQTGGRVINVSSGAANMAIAGWSAYCTSKAGLNQFTEVLAAEETAITSVAVRPGVVDTQMQAFIRQNGSQGMADDQVAYYHDLKKEGRLLPPEVPGRSIAWLALKAPSDLSGRFLNYDQDDVFGPAKEFFARVM